MFVFMLSFHFVSPFSKSFLFIVELIHEANNAAFTSELFVKGVLRNHLNGRTVNCVGLTPMLFLLPSIKIRALLKCTWPSHTSFELYFGLNVFAARFDPIHDFNSFPPFR